MEEGVMTAATSVLQRHRHRRRHHPQHVPRHCACARRAAAAAARADHLVARYAAAPAPRPAGAGDAPARTGHRLDPAL